MLADELCARRRSRRRISLPSRRRTGESSASAGFIVTARSDGAFDFDILEPSPTLARMRRSCGARLRRSRAIARHGRPAGIRRRRQLRAGRRFAARLGRAPQVADADEPHRKTRRAASRSAAAGSLAHEADPRLARQRDVVFVLLAATDLMSERARQTVCVPEPAAIASLELLLGWPARDRWRGATNREHLWSVARDHERQSVDATLANQPHYIAAMKEGSAPSTV